MSEIVPEWRRIAAGVLIRRYDELDLTVGLVLGQRSVLVIDSRGDHEQGAELAGAVREVTALPWQLAITHGHFDHCFGSAAFGAVPVWAHERCDAYLRATTERQRAEWIEHYRNPDPARAEALAATEVLRPNRPLGRAHELDLGGRSVRLLPLGAGHTDHDLVAFVPECGIVFAGDLVEHGAPPDFADAHPAQWPSTVDEILQLPAETVIPGHGDPVGREFVRAQRDEIGTVARLREAVRRGDITERAALADSPYPEATTRAAFRAPS